MSSEVKSDAQLKSQQTELKEESSGGILESVKEAVSSSLEAAKEAVFGKDEENLQTTSQGGVISSVIELAKEAVFGTEEESAKAKEELSAKKDAAVDAVSKKASEWKESAIETKDSAVETISQKAGEWKEAAVEKKDQLLGATSKDVSKSKEVGEEEEEEEEEEETTEEGTQLKRPTKLKAVKAGGRRIKQADHPHLGGNKPTRLDQLKEKNDEEREKETSEYANLKNEDSLALQKQKEEHQLVLKKEGEKLENLVQKQEKNNLSSKAIPSTYFPPEPTHSYQRQPQINLPPKEFPGH